MSAQENARAAVILYGARLVGDYLYAWGGDGSTEGGYDCSGYVCRVLTDAARSWPTLYDGQRRTAQGLADYYGGTGRGLAAVATVDALRPGMVVFYRRPGASIHHVALHAVTLPPLGGKVEVGPVGFEAGGSGSAATSPRAALLASATVRLTASDYHGQGAEWFALDPCSLIS